MKALSYLIDGRLCRVERRVHLDLSPRSRTYGRRVLMAHVLFSSGAGVTMPWGRFVEMECSGAATRIGAIPETTHEGASPHS